MNTKNTKNCPRCGGDLGSAKVICERCYRWVVAESLRREQAEAKARQLKEQKAAAKAEPAVPTPEGAVARSDGKLDVYCDHCGKVAVIEPADSTEVRIKFEGDKHTVIFALPTGSYRLPSIGSNGDLNDLVVNPQPIGRKFD